MSNWKVIFDNNSGTIVVDEPTDCGCWDFYHSSPDVKGYGSISTTRELCLKKILTHYKQDVKEKEKELKRAEKFVKKVEKELK